MEHIRDLRADAAEIAEAVKIKRRLAIERLTEEVLYYEGRARCHGAPWEGERAAAYRAAIERLQGAA